MRNFICEHCQDRGHNRKWIFQIVECSNCHGDPLNLLPAIDLKISKPHRPPILALREGYCDFRLARRIYDRSVYRLAGVAEPQEQFLRYED